MILTNTLPSGAVQGQTLDTLAAEGALCVDTAAVVAHAREHLTLINVCGREHRGVSTMGPFCVTGAVSDVFLPSQTSPFIRANPREQVVSEETRGGCDDSLFGSVFNLFRCFHTIKLTDLAGFAGAPPGRPQRGAALGLQRGSVDVVLAAVVLYHQPAGALHAVCGTTATTTTT